MSASQIKLASNHDLATEKRSYVDSNGNGQDEHYQRISPMALGRVPAPFSRPLKDADNADAVDLAVNASGGARKYDLIPATGEVLRVTRIRLVAHLASAPALSKFGDLAALDPGVTLKAYRTISSTADTEFSDPLAGAAKTALDLLRVAAVSFPSQGSEYGMIADLDLSESPIRLSDGDAGYLRATISEDLSGLTLMTITASGVREDLLG